MTHLIRRKARIEGKGEGLCVDLFSRLEAVETEVSMERAKDGALGLYALSMQSLHDLMQVSALYSDYIPVVDSARARHHYSFKPLEVFVVPLSSFHSFFEKEGEFS